MSEKSGWCANTKYMFTGIVLITVIIDQMIKIWVQSNFLPYETIPVIPYFNLRFSFNTGVSFSMLSELGQEKTWVLVAFALALSALLTYWAFVSKRMLEIMGYAFVVGGALGNVADRMYLGAVVDYLDFYYGDWHFPTFNGADVFINIGVFILIVDMIMEYKNKDTITEPKES